MSSRAATRGAVLLLAMILAAPLWLVKFPPLLDYPNHLASSFIIRHLQDPNSAFALSYGAEWAPRPYLLMELALVGLQYLASAQTAGRILLTLCVWGVPLGAWFFVRQAKGDERLATLALLTVYSPFFIMGFVSYELSLAICFFVLGAWLGWLERASLIGWLLLTAGVTVLYFTHLLGFAMAGTVVGFYSLCARLKLRPLLASWAMFVPGAGVYLVFSAGRMHWTHLQFRTLTDKLLGLPFPLLGYSYALDIVTLLILTGCLGWMLWRNPEVRWQRPWLAVAGILLLLFVIFPADIAGSDADRRLLPFLFVVALAGATFGRRTRILAAVVVLLFVMRMANVAQVFFAQQPRLLGLENSFSVLPGGARVLPIVEKSAQDRVNRASYMQFWAYAVIERSCFVPYLFDREDIHTLRIRLRTYVPVGLGEWGYKHPPDWQQVQRDYDYVWAYDVPRFEPALLSMGEVVYRFGELRVLRINKKPVAAAHVP